MWRSRRRTGGGRPQRGQALSAQAVGGESTTAVSGGTDPTPLKKQITLKEKCDNLQRSYDAQAVHRTQNLQKTLPNVAGANADLEIMNDLLAAMENLGC